MTNLKHRRTPASSRLPAAMQGFTLIELLVVIAVISILATILLPSLGRAQELARRATCSSTLRALSITLNLYANDNDGNFPSDEMYFNYNGYDRYAYAHLIYKSATDELAEYGLELAMLQCPSALKQNIMIGGKEYFSLSEDSTKSFFYWNVGGGRVVRSCSYAFFCNIEAFGFYSDSNFYYPHPTASPEYWNYIPRRLGMDNPDSILVADTTFYQYTGAWYASHYNGRDAPEGMHVMTAAGNMQWKEWSDIDKDTFLKPVNSDNAYFGW